MARQATPDSRPSTPEPAPEVVELAARLGPAARLREPMARHTSLRVGGPADLFFVPRTTEELVHAVDEATQVGVPWRVIGSASNLLVSDDGISGLVLKTATKHVGREIAPNGDGYLIHADAGCLLAGLGKQLALEGLAGLEWAINVPGTVGASVVNNSGAFGSCAAEHLTGASLHFPDSGTHTVSVADLGMAYRTSRLKRGEWSAVVLAATYRAVPGDRSALRERIAEIQRLRKSTQPAGFSVGSVFANPSGAASGRLIEEAGLKGHRLGDAEVSTLHANFILNRGRARAGDVLLLMREIQRRVWDRSGEWLLPEVQLVGRWRATDTQALLGPPLRPSPAALRRRDAAEGGGHP